MPNLSPNISDSYLTILAPAINEVIVKKSRFLAQCFPVQSKDEIDNILFQIHKEHYTANHHCFAYRIGSNDKIYHYSDDGEPSGTAGKPILQAIDHFHYTNVLVVVTRYFGGIKLGVGPLHRAFYDASFSVLSQATPRQVFLTKMYKIITDYNNINILKKIFEEFTTDYDEIYSEYVEFYPNVLISRICEFENEIIRKTNGQIHFEIIEN
ncbi:YigZ family protein [bacterium]|nr:YigZ family protein [bacterium]